MIHFWPQTVGSATSPREKLTNHFPFACIGSPSYIRGDVNLFGEKPEVRLTTLFDKEMKAKITIRVSSGILITALSILWLRELTLRRAIQATNAYLYPLIVHGKYYPYGFSFHLLDTVSDVRKCRFSPGWVAYVDDQRPSLDTEFRLRISLFGKVTGTTNYRVTDALNLPLGEERKLAIEKVINGK